MRRAAPERIKAHCEQEMGLFDMLPANVRSIISNHVESVSLLHVMIQPGVLDMAMRYPEQFGQRLKQKLDEAAQINRARIRAEVSCMVKEMKEKLDA